MFSSKKKVVKKNRSFISDQTSKSKLSAKDEAYVDKITSTHINRYCGIQPSRGSSPKKSLSDEDDFRLNEPKLRQSIEMSKKKVY